MTEYIKREDAIEALGEEPYVWSDTDVEIAEHAQWVSDVKAIEAVPSADVVTREQYEQIHWERDVALHQLEEIGKGLGEKMDDVIERIDDANTSNALNALDCVEERKKGEWDMFDLISSAYYGKGMYFKQDNGTVYSRHSGEYMTVDEAIKEFISLIDEENIAFVPSVTTVWNDGEAPTYVLQKKGKWEKHNDDVVFWWQCSECQCVTFFEDALTPYCPNCGAQMESEEEQEWK